MAFSILTTTVNIITTRCVICQYLLKIFFEITTKIELLSSTLVLDKLTTNVYIKSMKATGLALKVKQLREEREWSQNELGVRSGLGRNYIGSLEVGGIQHPPANKLLKIARAFNIHFEVLYEAAGYISMVNPSTLENDDPKIILADIKLNVRRLEKRLNNCKNCPEGLFLEKA